MVGLRAVIGAHSYWGHNSLALNDGVVAGHLESLCPLDITTVSGFKPQRLFPHVNTIWTIFSIGVI